jgi:hypothetical protein
MVSDPWRGKAVRARRSFQRARSARNVHRIGPYWAARLKLVHWEYFCPILGCEGPLGSGRTRRCPGSSAQSLSPVSFRRAKIFGLNIPTSRIDGKGLSVAGATARPRTLRAYDSGRRGLCSTQERGEQASLQHVIAHLRAFLRYCGDRGEIAADSISSILRVFVGRSCRHGP